MSFHLIILIYRAKERLAAVSVFILLFLNTAPGYSFELLLGIGEQDSFCFYAARAVCRNIEQGSSGFSCRVVRNESDLEALTNVQSGTFDLALVDSQLLYESVTRKGAFSFMDIVYDRLRVIAPLYDVPLILVVRNDSGIFTSSQLKGKMINVGPKGTPANRLFAQLMDYHNWSVRDFASVGEIGPGMSQDRIALTQGGVQALVYRGVHPNPDLDMFLNNSRARIVGFSGSEVEKMAKDNPALTTQYLVPDMYSSLSQLTSTIGTSMVLVASSDLDPETAETIIKALAAKIDVLRRVHPSLSSFELVAEKEWFGGVKTHETVYDRLMK